MLFGDNLLVISLLQELLGEMHVMNQVERFRAAMSFEPVDRLPVMEWAVWWDQTIDRWREEGLPAELVDPGEIREFLGLDSFRQCWIQHRRDGCPRPAFHGGPLINSAEEYPDFRDKFLFPEKGFETEQLSCWEENHSKGETVIWFTLEGFFWFPRTLLGIEQHLYAFFDQPDLIHRINSDLVDFHLKTLDQLFAVCSPDFMTFAEDLSYNHGPMLSKQCFDEFLAPYYRRVIPLLEEKGVLPFIDSDGDVTQSVPWFEEVGIRGVLPLERKAGVDVELIRERHPKFLMLGAYDKMVMKHGEQAMREEFERLLPTMRKGGFVPSVDHQTPPEVSLENYRVYVDLLKEYCTRGAPTAESLEPQPSLSEGGL